MLFVMIFVIYSSKFYMSIKSPFFQTNQFSCFRYYINLSLFTTIITIGTTITTIGPDLVKFSSFASESL